MTPIDVTVVVGTYGDEHWSQLAQRAIASVPDDVPHVHVHGNDLHGARNAGLDLVTTEWVCFLDADDELDSHYLEWMATGTADVRAPSVAYVRGRAARRALIPKVAGHTHDCTADCLSFGNWLIIGSLVRADMVRDVGGFRDFDWSEDWDVWVRCWQAGATFEAIPNAVYRAYVRTNSRNRGAKTREQKLECHRAIARANGLPVP